MQSYLNASTAAAVTEDRLRSARERALAPRERARPPGPFRRLSARASRRPDADAARRALAA